DKGFAHFEEWRDMLLAEEEREQHKLDRKIVAEEHWMRPRLGREAPAWLPLRAFRPGVDSLLNFAEALARTLADFGKLEAQRFIRDRLFDAWSKTERQHGTNGGRRRGLGGTP